MAAPAPSLAAHRQQWALHVRESLHVAVSAAVRRCAEDEESKTGGTGGTTVNPQALTRALLRELDPWLEQLIGVTTVTVGAPAPERTPSADRRAPLTRESIDAMGHVERGRALKARGLKVPRKAEERRHALIALLSLSPPTLPSKLGEKRGREEDNSKEVGTVTKKRLTVKDMLAQMKVPVAHTVSLVKEGGFTINPETRCIVERVREGTTVVKGRLHDDGITTLPLRESDTAWAERHNFIVMDVDQSKTRHQPLVYAPRNVSVHETVAEDEVLVLTEDDAPSPSSPPTRSPSFLCDLAAQMRQATLDGSSSKSTTPTPPPTEEDGSPTPPPVTLPPPPPPLSPSPLSLDGVTPPPLPRWEAAVDVTSTIVLPPPAVSQQTQWNLASTPTPTRV